MINLSPLYVQLVLGPVLVPLITALLVKYRASTKTKVLVNLFVSAVVSVIANSVVPDTGAAVFSMSQVVQALVTFITSAVGYNNFWKPVLDINATTAPEFGVGTVPSLSSYSKVG